MTRIGDALKGGLDVVSRVRIAAAACLVTSGLFIGGASGALAFAVPAVDGAGPEPARNDSTEARPDTDVDGERPDGEKPDGREPDGEKPDEQRPDDEEPGEGEDGERPTKEPEPTETTKPPPPEEPEPEGCAEKGDDDCGPGWPWWPWPDPGVPPEPGDGGVGGGHSDVPSGRPGELPPMQIPSHMLPPETPAEPATIDAEPGVGVAAAAVPLAPITLPVIVAPPLGIGAGAPRSLPGESLPGARGTAAEPPSGRQPPPGQTGSNVSVPASSYRVGYTDYLRSAGISQVVALAAPGLAGMLVLTGAGGLVGYRQAKAGHAVRTGSAARFVN